MPRWIRHLIPKISKKLSDLLVRLGPTFFEAWSIAMLAVAVNLITSLAIIAGTESHCTAINTCIYWGMVAVAIASVRCSFPLWHWTRDIFSRNALQEDRLEEMQQYFIFKNLMVPSLLWLFFVSVFVLLVALMIFHPFECQLEFRAVFDPIHIVLAGFLGIDTLLGFFVCGLKIGLGCLVYLGLVIALGILTYKLLR